MRRKILFLTGSINQTSQMYQIAQELPDYECWYSQMFYDDWFVNLLIKHTAAADTTVMGKPIRAKAEEYLRQRNCRIDYMARKNQYDLVLFCSEMMMTPRMAKHKTIWVQEGMTDKYTTWSRIVQKMRLPSLLTFDTSLNGSLNLCDVYCAASEGYKRYFAEHGVEESKIFPTGMLNFDDIQCFKRNDFPYRDYVMVATTDMRETYRPEDRVGFIRKTVQLAGGRQMLFKLHPNEKFDRAKAEIEQNTPPGTLIFQSGVTNEMIANCSELITQYSSVVYAGIALDKKVHSYFDLEQLKNLAPIQNGGTTARNIAHICRNFVEFDGPKGNFAKQFRYQPQTQEYA